MPASIPHNTALGTPINQSPVPITRPKAEFNANWDRKSLSFPKISSVQIRAMK
jgi:hypothetical protein